MMNARIRLVMMAAALMLPVWAAAAATAAPKDCHDLPMGHPNYCGETPSTTTTTSIADLGTCVDSVQDEHQVFTETDGFGPITVEPGSPACIDWTTTIASEWLVAVDAGTASSVYFSVRGSHPGDFCWLDSLSAKELKRGVTALTIGHSNGPLADGGPLPVASVGACGDQDDTAASFVLTIGPGGKPSPVVVTVTATG